MSATQAHRTDVTALSESVPGPYTPTLIIHGGAGNITRSKLPPPLYAQYHASLLSYLTSTKDLLKNGADAVEAACHAVSLMEDNPLFNCGRGSVFTIDGSIEMEASLMVTSINDYSTSCIPASQTGLGESTSKRKLVGRIKKNAAVSMITRTRHPILLAREVLAMADEGDGLKQAAFTGTSENTNVSSMHGHLSGQWVEEWGFKERGLERKGRKWFWTRKRWEEHRRGLGLDDSDRAWRQKSGGGSSELEEIEDNENDNDIAESFSSNADAFDDVPEVPSQGTVGAVCMDSWGNLCVATSTGGLTNKRSGRIGDTPTVGAGFWAECWADELIKSGSNDGPVVKHTMVNHIRNSVAQAASFWVGDCLPGYFLRHSSPLPVVSQAAGSARQEGVLAAQSYSRTGAMTMTFQQPACSKPMPSNQVRAVAMSGTGNGDSFLRVNAARTTAAIAKYSSTTTALQTGITAVTGPGGELQRSAGDRWGKTGEGEGGIIGIEAIKPVTNKGQDGSLQSSLAANVVFDFNCSGMWRAYYEIDEHGESKPKVMVFKEKYR